MKRLLNVLKNETKKNKKIYVFLIFLFIVGVIFGSFFITILDKSDKSLVMEQVSSFFNQIKEGKALSFSSSLSSSLISNILFVFVIWLLGLSIIGIPVILFMVFIRGFILGFSISSIILKYKIKGIIGGLFYIFPHHIIFCLLTIILSYYAFSLSIMFLVSILKKKSINFRTYTNKYLKILFYSIIISIIVSLIEVYISPFLIKLFLLIFG